jgi:hypothetical protein
MPMNIRWLSAVPSAILALVLPKFALAGSAEAAPGVHRPEWVIWAALGALMLLLIVVISMQGKGLRKGGKGGHPYL